MRPYPGVPHKRTSKTLDIVQVVAYVLRHPERVIFRKVDVHLGRYRLSLDSSMTCVGSIKAMNLIDVVCPNPQTI